MPNGNLVPFLSDFTPRLDPPETQLADAMRSAGLTPPDAIEFDGILHRWDDQKHGGDANWYIAFDGDVPAGRFGSWRTGADVTFRANIGRSLSPSEELEIGRRHAEARARWEAEKAMKNARAAETCQSIWEDATPATADHPYLARKGIRPHIARVTGSGRLVLPMYNPDGELSSLQYISDSGGKLFQEGAATKGCFSVLGSPDNSNRFYITEGFATGATVYETTLNPVIVAYSASNLTPVCEHIRNKFPTAEIIIVADNDKSGTGLNYATQASAKTGARVVMPPDEGDANDYKQAGGDLLALLSPAVEQWLVNASEFSKQPAPIKWLVKNWIQAEAMIMVHGPSGSGKTFVVLDWCLRLAAQIPDWIGHKIRAVPVVYLAGEGHHGIRSRISAWLEYTGYSGALSMWISRSGCDLNTPMGLQHALTQIRALPEAPGLVVVDTLHRFLSGDENSAQDTKTMLDACAVIQREFGCSTLLVHHTGVSDEAQHRARGSSAWRGALDIEISIQSKDDQIVITQKKSKDAEMADPVFVELKQVEIPGWFDEDGEPVVSAVIAEGYAPLAREKENPALESIKSAWWDSGADVVDGCPYISKSAWINAMVERGGMSEANAKQHVKPSDPKRYAHRLVSEGLAEVFQSGFKIVKPVIVSAWILAKDD